MKSENFKRIAVSFAAIPVIIAASWFGGLYFFSFVAIVGLISYYEFGLLVKHKGANVNFLLGGIIIFFFLLNQYAGYIDWFVVILISSLLLLTLELFRNKGSAIYNLGSTFLGVYYIGIFSAAIIALREFYSSDPATNIHGAYLMISVLASIWLGDSAAYYSGITFGRHKLFSRVSPKKSWEGALFGFIFSTGAMLLAKVLVLDFLNWKNVLIIGIIIGIAGQIGDLVESLIKRDTAVKDSSSLIPGHGGFFDRFDSLLFSAPVIWIYLKYLG